MSLPDGPRTPPTLQLIQWIANPLSFMRNLVSGMATVSQCTLAIKCLAP